MVEVFGLEEICQWNFELWNELENKQYFDGFYVFIKGYFMYYDVCFEGFKMVYLFLRLGGFVIGYLDKYFIFWVIIYL